jgi:hypothetical protein
MLRVVANCAFAVAVRLNAMDAVKKVLEIRFCKVSKDGSL